MAYFLLNFSMARGAPVIVRAQTTFPLLILLLFLLTLGPLWTPESAYPQASSTAPLPKVTDDSLQKRIASQALQDLHQREPFASLAVRDLANMGVRSAIPELASILEDHDSADPLLRLAAIEALGTLGGEEAMRALQWASQQATDIRQARALQRALARCREKHELIL
jgi:HEAT repeat protein